MAGVNGVEIKVGQVWRTRGGALATVESFDDHPDYPVNIKVEGDSASCGRNGRCWGDIGAEHTNDDDDDLIELVKDENGFTIWRGGEQPADTIGKRVEYRYEDDAGACEPADHLRWEHAGSSGDIHAYKVVEESTQADSATLAEETLIALGWTFDGQAWVEQPKVAFTIADGMGAPFVEGSRVRIEMLDPAVSAPALLSAAAKHMNDRAATYDKPEGERSMAQTVAIFEAFHDIKLSEAQGWHFMQVLKDVRLFTRESYHADSAEDCIAYAALKAEAKAQEGGA